MEVFVISFAVILLAILGMGVGVLYGRPGIKGSCGGLNTLVGLGLHCGECSKPCAPHEATDPSCSTHQHDASASHRFQHIPSKGPVDYFTPIANKSSR